MDATYQLDIIKTKIIPGMMKHPYSIPFRKPVDPKEQNISVSLFNFILYIIMLLIYKQINKLIKIRITLMLSRSQCVCKQ